MELDSSEKELILLEERYRHEIRVKLNEPKTDGQLKKFLNSSFGLWLLSAIFISGAGTLYQQWQKTIDEDTAKFQKKLDEGTLNQEVISKLDVEISYRLSSSLIELSGVVERVKTLNPSKNDDEKMLLSAQATFGILRSLSSKERAARDGLYPEFSTYTLSTLFAELRRRLPETERSSVEKSLAAFASISTSMQFKNTAPAPNQAAEALFNQVILKRWQGTAFHHIDCNAKFPFC